MSLLTAYNGQILGPIARVLGYIMDRIYVFLTETCGILTSSIALSIIIFTVFIYICLFPLTYRQQKYSVLTRKMQPELKAIQKKYKGKKDQASMQAMQEETQMLYDKYGTSPTGSCVQMLIQMPILFALYRVFYNVPAYLTSVKSIFSPLVKGIMGVKGYEKIMERIFEDAKIPRLNVDFTKGSPGEHADFLVDVLYKLPESGWDVVKESFPNLTDQINAVQGKLTQVNYIGPVNISDTPWNMFTTAMDHKAFGLMVAAAMIPILSYLSQMVNIRMMPTAGGDDQMAQQMKTMNMMMPLMSLFFTFITPAGLGVYWIVGALVRIVQQFFLNRHFEKLDLDAIIEENKEKAQKKAEKRGIRRNQISNAATMNTKRSFAERAKVNPANAGALEKAEELRNQAKPGSMAAKANLVKKFNENK